MNVKKKANKFGTELVDLMSRQGKLPADIMGYVMATEFIHLMIGDGPPSEGLNDLFQVLGIAARDQGYVLRFAPVEPPTIH